MNWPELIFIKQVRWNLCCPLWHPGLVPSRGRSATSPCTAHVTVSFLPAFLARVRNQSWPLSLEALFISPSLFCSLLAQLHSAPESGLRSSGCSIRSQYETSSGKQSCPDSIKYRGDEVWLSQGIRIHLPSALPSGPSCRSQVDAYFDFSWKGLVAIDGKSDLWFRCHFHVDNLSILLSTLRGWNTNSCICLVRNLLSSKAFCSLSVPDGVAVPAKQLEVKGSSIYAYFVMWFCRE